MELLNDIFNEIMSTAQESLCDKARKLINQGQLKKKLISMEKDLDQYLIKNFENELYYDSLDKYIHDGKETQDTDSTNITSAFYYTLLCAFLSSDNKFLGHDRFFDYHWENIQKKYPNRQFDKDSLEKCFLHYYNTFREEFGCPLETDISLVNALKETSNDNSDIVLKSIINESEFLKSTIYEGVEKILKQNNSEIKNQQKKEDRIHDDNSEYQERLNDSLFLESNLDDGKKVSLADVYIAPHIEFNFDNLKQWVEDRDSRILLLYGKAGIGKTSFTSWISLNNNFTQECHMLELRQYINFFNSGKPWESIKKCYQCDNDDKYQNKILVLDGLDEVCVLKSDFNGLEFIKNLSSTLKTGIGRNIRVIITSRMGYFDAIRRTNYIDVATIFWGEDSVVDWCSAYCKIHNNRIDWCESFKKIYAELNPKDKRKEVFCTPLILYICCVSQVDISKHYSVASIYDEAFNILGTRQYNEWDEDTGDEFEINKQFTKELAFQMFLNDKLEDILDSKFIQIAKEKVVCWGHEKLQYRVEDVEFEKLFAINHFAYGKNNAIEFAHKTIGEYFTAVKLYEDYFNKIDGTVENTWNNIFNAFRYKKIPFDIMQYLIDLILKRKDKCWIEDFFKAYYSGFENQTLYSVACFNSCYSTSSVAMLKQIQIAFRNLTWLLTNLGFDNSSFINKPETLQVLASYLHGDVNMSGWRNMERIDLSNLNLENSNFKKACLQHANFTSTILDNVDFSEAILESAEFRNANLNKAIFEGADLGETYFTKANLVEANLTGAYLKWAHFSEACLKRAHLERAILIDAFFEGADLKEADFTGADLVKADFTGADLTRTDFKFSNLKDAKLKEAELLNNDFTGAKGIEYMSENNT